MASVGISEVVCCVRAYGGAEMGKWVCVEVGWAAGGAGASQVISIAIDASRFASVVF